DARVYGNAGVYGNVWVFGNAEVYDNAEVYGDARVSGNAGVSGDARVTKAVINIIGFPYNTTLTDNHIQIGCKQLTFNQALRLAENWEKTLKKYKEAKEIESIKPILIELIKYQMKEEEKLQKDTNGRVKNEE
ncbi:MAG: hypothetical protein M0P94_04495, partial [Candidatus Absconditabacterales bacterium]|nr:hypothetical protein [Candidatus Absconditabacterales bacterium]